LLLTGKDQYGAPWPLFARSFGDYDEALYRYLTIPSVALFGLSAASVRLPAALAGSITVVLAQRLGHRWFGGVAGWVAGVLLCVSPWHLQFSRIAFRAILLPCFLCAALLFFDRGLAGRPRNLIVSGLLFGIALATYSAGRLFVPVFFLCLCGLYFPELKKRPKYALGMLAIFGCFLARLATFWVTEKGMARVNVLLLADFGLIWSNYWSYFGFDFLFRHGDLNWRHNTSVSGELYPFELATVILGLAATV